MTCLTCNIHDIMRREKLLISFLLNIYLNKCCNCSLNRLNTFFHYCLFNTICGDLFVNQSRLCHVLASCLKSRTYYNLDILRSTNILWDFIYSRSYVVFIYVWHEAFYICINVSFHGTVSLKLCTVVVCQ